MELEEAKKILMGLPEYQDLVSKEFEAIDTVIHELVALQELLDEKKEELEEYSKQMDLDYVDENYISKDKIKEKIEELDKNELLGKYNYEQVKIAIDILNELLIDKEPKKYSTYEIQRNIMPELLKGE